MTFAHERLALRGGPTMPSTPSRLELTSAVSQDIIHELRETCPFVAPSDLTDIPMQFNFGFRYLCRRDES